MVTYYSFDQRSLKLTSGNCTLRSAIGITRNRKNSVISRFVMRRYEILILILGIVPNTHIWFGDKAQMKRNAIHGRND